MISGGSCTGQENSSSRKVWPKTVGLGEFRRFLRVRFARGCQRVTILAQSLVHGDFPQLKKIGGLDASRYL